VQEPPPSAAPSDRTSTTSAEPTVEPESTASPVLLHVSYANLGTASGSDLDLHADGTLVRTICNVPSSRNVSHVSAADVEALRIAMQRCKLCELAKLPPKGDNYYKQLYRVTASWPDLQCEADVSARSHRFYDARAKRCHQALEAFLHAQDVDCNAIELPGAGPAALQ
jgi:hypothetical protein